MIEFGSIVLTRFPFTDLTGGKLRPALVISRDNGRRSDLVLAFITSKQQQAQDAIAIQPSEANGLKVPSWVRFDKLATLENRVIAGESVTPELNFSPLLRRCFSAFLDSPSRSNRRLPNGRGKAIGLYLHRG